MCSVIDINLLFVATFIYREVTTILQANCFGVCHQICFPIVVTVYEHQLFLLFLVVWKIIANFAMRISATPMRKYAYQGGTFILYRFELSKITHFNIWPDILAERRRTCYWRWYLYQRAVGCYLKPQMPFCVQVCFVFTAVFVYRVVFAVCKPQRFLFHLRPDVFSMRSLWVSTVFILFIAVSVFRVAHRATALHSDKAVESSLS